ncbi:tripartite motif family-like 1 [Cricetulus griseus]
MSIQEKISTVDLMESLREELTCFICLDYFSGPVTTECGHSFCLMCLLKSWEEHNTPLSCPECWRTLGSPHFQANERLGRLASIGRQLRSQVLQNEDEQSSCGRTPGASWVFSDDEQSVINFSTQCHGINRTYFSSEAEEQHKEKLQDIINLLRKKKKEAQTILNHEKERVMLCLKIGDDYSLWVSSPLKGQHVREPVHKVGVFLDYESGHIAFYNVTDETLIYSFPSTSFHEALRPIFSPCLPNEGTNTDPLVICHI